ncbi:hypothetical protein [Moraxella lacunata]|uniref:hypothetical protein n=1 Tax=Moraxella lacunata TaxID=477 RepID=UPI003EE0C876
MKIDKSTYVIWAILLPLSLLLYYDTCKGWITLLVLGICLLFMNILEKYVKKIKNYKTSNLIFYLPLLSS